MNEVIVCKPSPVKRLSITRAPLRELLNFLTYQKHSDLLTERARRQPVPSLEEIPTTVKELKNVLGAEKCDKNEKLFFDCQTSVNHAAILLHNEGAQFWIHYFKCGIGLVNLSFFNHLVSAEGSLLNEARNVTHSHEYQWFTHDLKPRFFTGKNSVTDVSRLGDYFIEHVNPTLVCLYSIYYESWQIKEPYKFISGSLERLTEILMWARFVCEGLKREREPSGGMWVSPHLTITCGNLRNKPTVEHSTETIINAVGSLAISENSPYTVLHKKFGRHDEYCSNEWMRKNKHYIFLNLEQSCKDIPVREKIAARFKLVNWLRQQGLEGERVVKTWHLEMDIVNKKHGVSIK